MIRTCVIAALCIALPAGAADEVNCDPDAGMVDIEHCAPPSPAHPDPFEDKVLTCEEMRAYPHRVFGHGMDLGSGHGSPLEVDYSCKESLASLPFLKKLHALTEEVRSDGGPPHCTGSIIHAHWRYYHFELLEAGFAPEKLLERDQRDRRSNEILFPQAFDENLFAYFERWSYESISNHDLYRAYMAELRSATPLLAAHYKAMFGHGEAKARALSRRGLKIFVQRAAGTFPRDGMTETALVLEAARAVSGSLDDLPRALDRLYVDYVRSALNIALLKERPRAHIAAIADRLDSLDHGNESALFFALRNRSNVAFLLDRGANVNYQNGFGKTPLYYAIGFNDHSMARLLLERGARVNHAYKVPEKPDDECLYHVRGGRAPLMHAAQHADVPMLEMLIARGASLKSTDAEGHNALDYALLGHKPHNAAFLKSRGLVSMQVENELARREKLQLCFRQGKEKKLTGRELGEFLRECWK